MNIIIKSSKHVLTDASQELIEKKLRLLERFVPDHAGDSVLLEAEAILMPEAQQDGAKYQVDVNCEVQGKLYRATARSETLESAVEEVRHELEQELRRSHGKTRRLLKRGGAAIKRALRGWS